ncbi:hypothetical protein DMA12_19555 [Amycolatopsis balhimycina DSM 5908]|uniref:HNH endonuclease n=1 Tax=Amycolatopsis balhimycina DSM 5908 TaxID=1081091 RepID=A0A428WJ90_AMYBA|nr:hypothetical protein DMA12_19555 [Amycolatopsis balhimycina DSM 5908]
MVGDEAHIAARSPGGPRHNRGPAVALDSYDNLILLCKVDDKKVDDQPGHYTVTRLKKIKHDHEAWVQHALDTQTSLSQPSLEEANRQKAQLLSGYRVLNAAFDTWKEAIMAASDANVLRVDPEEERALHAECTRQWQNAHLACGQFAAVATPECADLAGRVLDGWKSLADDVVDGLWPSDHPGADQHDDLDINRDELLSAVSTELGMTRSAVLNSLRAAGKLGGTGKRF